MRLYLTAEVDFKRQNINIWNVHRETSLTSSFLQQQSVLLFIENLPNSSYCFWTEEAKQMRKCATLKTDLLPWMQQFSSRDLILSVLWCQGYWRLLQSLGAAWLSPGDPCRCVTPDLVQCRSSEVVILHLLILLRGSFRLRRKFKVIHEVKIPPFPTTPIGKQGLPCLRPTVAGVAPLLFLCFPHGECECRLLRAAESVSHLWLVGDSATCELHWGDYELCVSTFSIHQAPILFVSPVSPSAILIASTFHTQLQLEAVMLQGCP